MKRQSLHPLVHAVWLSLIAQSALADNDMPAAGAMAVVEIVGLAPLPGLGIERNLLPYTVQTVSAAAMARAPGQNLSEFMARNLTGVNVNEISGSPFQNDITYRGFRASPVLGTSQGISVYLDGVRVNEPFGDVVNWDMLPEAAISNVLLVPGSNPLYGLNTLGGALALTTKSGLSHPGFEADLSTSSGGQRRSDLAYGYHDGTAWHAFIAATLFNDRGWRDDSNGRLGNYFLKLGGTADDTDWNLALLGGNSTLVGNGLLPSYRASDDGLAGGLYEDNRRASYTFPDQTHNRLRQATLSAVHRYSSAVEVSANAYLRNSRRDTVNGDGSDTYGDYVSDCADGFLPNGAAREPDECGYTRAQGAALHTASLNTTSTRQDSHGLSINVSATLDDHQWLAGVAYDHSKVSFAQFEQDAFFTPARGVVADPDAEREATSSVAGTSNTYGLYLTDTWRVAPATHVTASARYNVARVGNTLTNGDDVQPHEQFTYRKLNPALGLTHDLTPAWTLFGNLSQSNRAPTVIELGCADPDQPCRLPVGLQSDPYLKQVVARTAEAGLRWHPGPDSALSLSLYRTVNQDDILFRSAGVTQQGYFSNFSRTLHQGLDLSADRRFGAVALHASYSYLDATYDADGDLFTGSRNVHVGPGTRIAGLPRHTFKLNLDWNTTAALTLGADVMAVSDLLTQGNEDGLLADPVAGAAPVKGDWSIRGYALLGLHASYRPAPRWELYARVNNVADRRYETYGAVAVDMFPNGRLLQPQNGAEDVALARFVAPGAPRSVQAGLRYHF